MTGRYWVDWTDGAFPEIKLVRPGIEHLVTPQTFREAKAEIVAHFTHQAQHARDMIARTAALRASSIDPEAR